jgi:hypothetical protein
MDLVDTLKKKIEVLDDGDYILGLRAVLRHIETAFRHLSRGQEIDDETAFTDAIYRTNQAFEGSIKEAYRVLAGQDPQKKRPFDIENYLEQTGIFRSRVRGRPYASPQKQCVCYVTTVVATLPYKDMFKVPSHGITIFQFPGSKNRVQLCPKEEVQKSKTVRTRING